MRSDMPPVWVRPAWTIEDSISAKVSQIDRLRRELRRAESELESLKAKS